MKTEKYIVELSEDAAIRFSNWLSSWFEAEGGYAGMVKLEACNICCGLFTDADHHGHIAGWS